MIKKKTKHTKQAKKLWEIDIKPCGEESPYRKYLDNKGDANQEHGSNEPAEANPDVLSEDDGLYPPKEAELTQAKLEVIKKNWKELSIKQRQVLRLLSESDRTYKDVADILGISKGSVQKTVERIRQIMAEDYEKEL